MSGAAVALVPVHPEPVPGDARELRWVTPPGTLDFVGAVAEVPTCLAALLDDGTVESLHAEPTAVRVRLGADRTWRTDGTRVRSGLQRALADAAGWRPLERSSPDDVLRAAVDQVVDGEVGAYIRSHGGALTVLGVRGGYVEVELTGTCSHCPAAELTLAGRFETAVRELHPALLGVRASRTPTPGPRRPLGLLPLRRR